MSGKQLPANGVRRLRTGVIPAQERVRYKARWRIELRESPLTLSLSPWATAFTHFLGRGAILWQ
jgi:hypothetical protein